MSRNYRREQFRYIHDVVRPQVARAFKELRKTGLICRMNFEHCSGCAGAMLNSAMKARKARGTVYFHTQDDSSFRNGYDLHIRYSTNGGDDRAAWVAIGEEVKAALIEQGLIVEWDGDPDCTVTVKIEESYDTIRKAVV